MKTIWYEDIIDVLLSIADPNTWWAISSVPWVSAPKINWATSIYNVEAEWWSGIAWWSTNVNWYASDYNIVSRWSGSVYLPDWTSITISSGSTGNMSAVTYIYYDRDLWSVQTTTSAQSSVWENKILLCVASPTSSGKDAEFQAFGTNKQSTFITADNIAANTITGNEIQANSITANELNVSTLSAITANMWDVHVWDIDSGAWLRIYPYSNSLWIIEFYYNWSVIGTMQSLRSGWVNYVRLNSNNILLSWNIYNSNVVRLNGKLKIPVWTDLYE